MTSQPTDVLGGPDLATHEDVLGGDAPGREDVLGGGDRAEHEDVLGGDAPGREDVLSNPAS